MTPVELVAESRAPLARRILGSFLAAAVGWIPPVLLLVIIGLIDWRHTSVTGWGGTIAFALIFGKFVFGTWLFVLLPLYLFVPLRSVLWRWPVCTACGAVCGALILFFYWRLLRLPVTAHEIRDEMPSLIVAAFVGATACLFGSLTARRFHFTRST